MQTFRSSPLTVALLVGVSIVTLLALSLGIASLARANTVSTLAVGASQQTGIAVCGHGTATITPDQAHLVVGVQATAAHAQDARTQAAQAMNAVLAALKNNGVADQDIQTAYFSIQPVYDYSNGKGQPQLVGYQATNTVQATIRKVGDTGKIVDAVTQAGGDNVQVSGINFSSSDPTKGMAQAQQNALNDAHNQAQQIAQGAGVSLGAPISIEVGSCNESAFLTTTNQSASGTSTNPTTPIQAGQQQVSVEVGVVYALR
jgi:uncharacterized protein